MSDSEVPNIHAYCLDCGKVYNDEKYSRTGWFQDGQSAPCTLCGGITAILHEEDAAGAISRSQRKRGITRDAVALDDENKDE